MIDMTLIQRKLCALLLLIFGGAMLVQAQSPGQSGELPPLELPGLLLIVVLDDSATMYDDINSLVAANLAAPARLPTDPDDLRGQAVLRLLDTLQQGSERHQVAVLSFSRQNDPPRWLSAEEGESDVFVTLDSASETDGRLNPRYQALVEAIQNRGERFPGPGDTVQAYETLLPGLRERLDVGANLKPVVMLVTDDVPIRAFSQSPFGERSESWQADYIDPILTQLAPLAEADVYTGYCPRLAESATSQGVKFAFMPMGAANWVAPDGTLSQDENNQPAPAPDDNYFHTLARQLDSFAPDGNTALVYPVDAGLAVPGNSLLRRDFFEAVTDFLRDMRCTYPLDVQEEPLQTRTDFRFDVSPLQEQVQLVIDIPGGGGEPSLQMADESIAGGDVTRSVRRSEASALHIWTLNRVDFAPEVWNGEWRIQVPGVTSGVLVSVDATLNVQGLAVQDVQTDETWQPNTATPFSFVLTRDGLPLTDNALIEAVEGRIVSANVDETIIFSYNEGRYTVTIPPDALPENGLYTITAQVIFAERTDVPLPGSVEFALGDYSAGSGFSFGPVPQAQERTWQCPDGTFRLEQPFSIGSFAPGSQTRSSNLDPESVGSYGRVEIYYPAVEPPTEATPYRVMRWNMERSFVAELDCSTLQAGDSQEMLIVADFSREEDRQKTLLNFNFRPTATPTLTPTPLASPTVVASPTPIAPDVIGGVERSVRGPFGWLVGMVMLLGGVIGGGLFLRTLAGYLFPLARVVMIKVRPDGEELPREDVLRHWWQRYNPFWQRRTIRQRMSAVDETVQPVDVVTVSGSQGGQALKIQTRQQGVRVNGQRVDILNPVHSTRRETIILYNGTIYRLINRAVT